MPGKPANVDRTMGRTPTKLSQVAQAPPSIPAAATPARIMGRSMDAAAARPEPARVASPDRPVAAAPTMVRSLQGPPPRTTWETVTQIHAPPPGATPPRLVNPYDNFRAIARTAGLTEWDLTDARLGQFFTGLEIEKHYGGQSYSSIRRSRNGEKIKDEYPIPQDSYSSGIDSVTKTEFADILRHASSIEEIGNLSDGYKKYKITTKNTCNVDVITDGQAGPNQRLISEHIVEAYPEITKGVIQSITHVRTIHPNTDQK